MTDQEYFEWLKMQKGPRISEQDYFSIRPMPPDGHFKTKDTTHIQIGDAIITGRMSGKVVTASGAVIAAEAVKLRCTPCGRFDSEGERCVVCQHMVCVLCVRRLDIGTGEKAFCPEHARLALYHLNTWLLADREEGGS